MFCGHGCATTWQRAFAPVKQRVSIFSFTWHRGTCQRMLCQGDELGQCSGHVETTRQPCRGGAYVALCVCHAGAEFLMNFTLCFLQDMLQASDHHIDSFIGTFRVQFKGSRCFLIGREIKEGKWRSRHMAPLRPYIDLR